MNSTHLKPSLFCSIMAFAHLGIAQAVENWETAQTANSCTARHENAFTKVGDKLYLIGGRGTRPVDEFDPKTNSWKQLAAPPVEMNLFQAVEYNNEALPVRQDFGEFHRDYEWMGIQRHIKVLGIFARLYHRDGKDGYLKDMPLVADYLRRACERYREFGPLVKLLVSLEARQNQVGYTF